MSGYKDDEDRLRAKATAGATDRMRKLVEFDPLAGQPTRWLMLLEQMWPNDTASHSLLQEWFGLCLTPNTSFQKALLIVGPPQSGKTLIADVLHSLLGPAASGGWGLGNLVTSFGMEPLLDMTLVSADLDVPSREDRIGRTVAPDALRPREFDRRIARMLSIVEGQRVTVDRRHRVVVKCKLPTRFLLLSNPAPWFTNADAARDFCLGMVALQLRGVLDASNIPDDRFQSELPAILLWAIKGWGRLRARARFEQPASSVDLVSMRALQRPPSRAEASRAFDDGQEHRPPAGVGLDSGEPDA